MIIHATQSSPLEPSEIEADSGAKEGAEQTGDFAQLLFLMLAPQTTVINPSPAASEGETAEGVSAATLQAAATIAPAIPMPGPAAGAASPETLPAAEVELFDGPTPGAPITQMAPAGLSASNPNVNRAGLIEEGAVPEEVRGAQGEKPVDDPIALISEGYNQLPTKSIEHAVPGRVVSEPSADNRLGKETAAVLQPVSAASVPVVNERPAGAKISTDDSMASAPTTTEKPDGAGVPAVKLGGETVLGQSAGGQKPPVLGAAIDPVHGGMPSEANEVSGASTPRQPGQSVNEVTPSAPTAGEAATRIDLNRGSENQHPKHDLLAGGDRNAWPDPAERDLPMSDRTVPAGHAFNALIARGEQDPGVAGAPPSIWRPLVDRLAGDISSYLRVGKSEAVLQLDPPELGRIKIDLSMEDGRLHARIVAEGHDSQALIEAHLPELRQALLASKIEVADVRVSQGTWSGAGDLGQGLQQQPHGRQETGRGFDAEFAGSPDGKEPRPQTSARENGRVSKWA